MDVTGMTFGRLMVLAEAPRHHPRHRRVLVQCVCGVQKSVRLQNLRQGLTQSCGCYHREDARIRFRTHGQRRTREWRSWAAAKSRCNNPHAASYKDYGGRGIRMCDRWMGSFEAFLADMGPKPTPLHSLDRWPDNDGNYEPENCRWATPREQRQNQRRSPTTAR